MLLPSSKARSSLDNSLNSDNLLIINSLLTFLAFSELLLSKVLNKGIKPLTTNSVVLGVAINPSILSSLF